MAVTTDSAPSNFSFMRLLNYFIKKKNVQKYPLPYCVVNVVNWTASQKCKLHKEFWWNSSCAMIERALKLKQAVNRFVQKSSESSADKLSLSSQEWDFLAVVFELLKKLSPTDDEENIISDEFECYLKEPIVSAPCFTDIINCWLGQRISYPVLPKMAMDILAIPATSVPVEREFSGLSDIITPNRAKINPLTIETLYDLKGYLKFGGDAATNFIQLI
ncbi:Uncharacterized protein APZ42_030399 [Daphnia magna]|uniref:HAT C-terminal dimerisation domain-containing protein n=1 Tax=Daphnia magna TaxID=35525 RepID=A0A164NSI8_9CRUS|nr:Uncharacterized protein APZ42_030399 [Daphnia magna]